ncbi:Succinoglycan biosynthesis protein ExoA [Hyphomicrobium sp. 1Nfss2.1]
MHIPPSLGRVFSRIRAGRFMSFGPSAFASIVMPALNEEKYIADAIRSITPRDGEGFNYEILILDGGSSDQTVSIVESLAVDNPRIRLIKNERRSQAAAMNIAARAADARSDILVRADCHADYPPGFVSKCIETMRTKDVASVVVSMNTRGKTCLQRAIAAAQNSIIGNGGSAHRVAGRSGYVDHGHHAAFDRREFIELGGYDESFTHNEDAEFDVRLVKSGRRIYLSDVSITYFPRSDFVSLARQYFKFGWGRANTIIKHRARPKLRQIMPLLVLLGCSGALLLAAFHWLFLLPVGLYAALCIGWGLVAAYRQRDLCLSASGTAAMVMHLSWGVGAAARIVRLGIDRFFPTRASVPMRTPSASQG